MSISIQPTPGAAMAGGFYAGRIRLDDGTVYALIVAPKIDGEHKPAQWIGGYTDAPGALSYNDGLANTEAMAAAGSTLAKWARGLRIDGHDDWYLPSQDELEVIYRNLKPTSQDNYCWARSGINLSAVDPTRPYTLDHPAQTLAEEFRDGGAEAFELGWYWTSTRHVANPKIAWAQDFYNGNQINLTTDYKFRARAVRRLIL